MLNSDSTQESGYRIAGVLINKRGINNAKFFDLDSDNNEELVIEIYDINVEILFFEKKNQDWVFLGKLSIPIRKPVY